MPYIQYKEKSSEKASIILQMKLIVGLGNKGEKYKHNRHNVGFMFIDYMAKWLKGQIVEKNDSNVTIYQCNNLILAKPQTFMNKSGEAVKKLIKQYISNDYQLTTNDLIVIHDDLDIPFGKFRIVRGYGPKLHNGLESIQNHLHTMGFLRIRIGVDNRSLQNRIPGIDYVLEDFSQEEQSTVNTVFDQIIERIKTEKIILF
ncbi:aminoacyl-tRNA hydrolase [Candidatus Roizmanbacteria bacterium CG_4_10_14_0_8_um_filter_33_9]|uniref:Peptidyl-tRNA hydrolase n=1 Tax=Candidatus Roizmanbacteria bacterium CG_4_10_14_0_8_um_filter_33_9 TaxID=1974826 RepID=A0A2M7QJI2_9BACT|nr:MAG: aminoacyl-tRNA hydrolase [Candidatus Roizmanbacteria bacterium CG_4_10_14_0_8_um_filter_33_9]